MPARHIYNPIYYRYINEGSLRSAQILLPLVTRAFTVRSVVDFGSGQGAWLAVWRDLGVTDGVGLDGDYVDRSSLLVPADRFVAADLTTAIRLERKFDLVQSLEVAEHLPASAAGTFVDNLVAHGDVILFSAAAPGQGGEHHVNERPYGAWRDLFHARGYSVLDMIRPVLARDTRVEPWYRYNAFVFVRDELVPTLPAALQATRIPAGARILDVSPALYQLRKALFRPFPPSVITQFARLKKHWHVLTRPATT
jgi:hypothetical protein